MKAAVVFVLLFATVLCRPARKVSDSSSDSSEEVVRRPAPAIRKQPLAASRAGPAPVQKVAAAAAGSDESAEASEEDKEEAAAPVEVSADPEPTPDTASVDSQDSEDEDDKEEEETEEDETEEEEDDSSDSSDSESGESSTVSAVTVTPVVVTEEPVAETTEDPILPTIVTDPDAGRGDSLGGYPSDYKSIIYVEEKSYHKHPGPYKSYELLGVGKKVAYDMVDGNEVEKSPKAYKAFQVHSDLLEEDTSTPEVESQGLDASSGLSQDQDISTRQAPPPEEEEEEEGASASESESSSAPEQEEEEQQVEEEQEEESASSSDSQEAEAGGSSEEGGATATPGATPGASDSDESDSAESDSAEEGGAGPEPATQGPEVVAAK
ncbi:osteopontin isoform 2-T2 [Menidia menidia]